MLKLNELCNNIRKFKIVTKITNDNDKNYNKIKMLQYFLFAKVVFSKKFYIFGNLKKILEP